MEFTNVDMRQPFPWALIVGSVLLLLLLVLAETQLGRSLARAMPALSHLLDLLRLDHKSQVDNDANNPEENSHQVERPGTVPFIDATFGNTRESLRWAAKRQGSAEPPPERIPSPRRMTNDQD